jgi:DnaJ-class molecular chaperone
MCGFLWSPTPKPEPSRRKKVMDGLWYRTCGDYEVIVEVSKKFLDDYEDSAPISADSRAEFKRCNMDVHGCANEGDATAVRHVLWNMDLFCPKCNETTLYDDDRCPSCNARLWREQLTFTLQQVAK